MIIVGSKLYSKDEFYKSKLPGTERDRRNIISESNVEARFRLAEVATPPELRKIVREAKEDRTKWALLPFSLEKLLDESRNTDLGLQDTSCLRNKALLNASPGANLFDWYTDYVARPPSWHVRHIKDYQVAPLLPPAMAKDFPSLTASCMIERGYFRGGDARGHLLGSHARIFGDRSPAMIVDMRDRDLPLLMFGEATETPSIKNWLRVDLISPILNRWHFLCPITGEVSDTLYFRQGYVGSRRGLNLE